MTFLFPKEPELHSSWKVLRMIILVNNEHWNSFRQRASYLPLLHLPTAS